MYTAGSSARKSSLLCFNNYTTSLVPKLNESESGEPSSLFCAKAGMLVRVLVCNYAREYHQTWMPALIVYLKLLKRIPLLL